MNKVDIYQDVTDRILEAMETGDTNWLKPFTASSGMPANAVTRNEYHGINVLLLGLLSRTNGLATSNGKQRVRMFARVRRVRVLYSLSN